MTFLIYVLAPFIALAVDWAFYQRTLNVIDFAFGPLEKFSYRQLLWPRVLFTVISSFMIAHGAGVRREFDAMSVGGIVIFLAANFWIYGYIVWKSRSLKR